LEVFVKRFFQVTIIVVLSIMLLSTTFAGGVLVGHFAQYSSLSALVNNTDLRNISISTPEGASQSTPTDLETLFKPFWEAWQLVHTDYVDQPVDDTQLMRGAIRGMLESLGDQHTSYMDPEEYNHANESLSGAYEGIGAYVDTGGDFLTVISPINGSPAEKAGLRAGDMFTKINGEDMSGIDPELVRQKVLGPAGTVVVLTVVREGVAEPFDVSITRGSITIASVELEMLDNQVAHVMLNTFGESTASELRDVLKQAKDQGAVGIVLDLRNNGGGYLLTAVDVASEFIGSGPIVYEKYGDARENDVYNAVKGGTALDIPLVVLVNEGSASASEIVAGALQDTQRAKLVGVTTYGKGSVQIWTPLSDDQGAVRITVAKWLTPNERTIHQVGLTPDAVVEMTEEDHNNGVDPQLDSAVQVLLDAIQ